MLGLKTTALCSGIMILVCTRSKPTRKKEQTLPVSIDTSKNKTSAKSVIFSDKRRVTNLLRSTPCVVCSYLVRRELGFVRSTN
ncbi:hypothetical protein F4823DRAFT_617072 [Ustulina deusta]|nr:hypothetical protein F4823DRAFT_617072 [Ustulina deusta]